MKDKYELLIKRIDVFNRRERIMLLCAVVVALYVIWDAILLRPLETEKKQLSDAIANINNQVGALDTQINTIIEASKIDPDAVNKQRLEEAKKQIQAIDETLRSATFGLVTPKDMPKILEDVLNRNKSLKLVRMESIPVVSLVNPTDATKPTETVSSGIFRHGLLMEIEGSYLDTLVYLKSLEQLPWKIYWDSIEFKTSEYPTARVIIKVYTLSLDKGWIGV